MRSERKIDLRHWNKGGRREGSGRKPRAVKKVQLTIRVAQDTAEFLKSQAALRGIRIGELIDRLVEQFRRFGGGG